MQTLIHNRELSRCKPCCSFGRCRIGSSPDANLVVHLGDSEWGALPIDHKIFDHKKLRIEGGVVGESSTSPIPDGVSTEH